MSLPKPDPFLVELESRLEENRRLLDHSWLPRPLHPVATYLGFHPFRSLLLLSLTLTLILYYYGYLQLINFSKIIFFLH